jgi:hypothetical protein
MALNNELNVQKSLINLEQIEENDNFLSESRLEHLGKNYLDFIASAESRFPLLFGKEAQIRKFKKFKASKLEYQHGARGGKYSELGTKKDIINKLSQNKLLERRLKKEKSKKLYHKSAFRSNTLKNIKSKKFLSRTNSRRSEKETKMSKCKSNLFGKLPFRIQKINTIENKINHSNLIKSKSFHIKQKKTLNRTNTKYQCQESHYQLNNLKNLFAPKSNYKIKKCKSSFFFKKKKFDMKSKFKENKQKNNFLCSFVKIKSYRNPIV